MDVCSEILIFFFGINFVRKFECDVDEFFSFVDFLEEFMKLCVLLL